MRGQLNYFRLHGLTGYHYTYSDEELKKLAGLCRARENYVLFNNASMWEDAGRFKGLARPSICSPTILLLPLNMSTYFRM